MHFVSMSAFDSLFGTSTFLYFLARDLIISSIGILTYLMNWVCLFDQSGQCDQPLTSDATVREGCCCVLAPTRFAFLAL